MVQKCWLINGDCCYQGGQRDRLGH